MYIKYIITHTQHTHICTRARMLAYTRNHITTTQHNKQAFAADGQKQKKAKCRNRKGEDNKTRKQEVK